MDTVCGRVRTAEFAIHAETGVGHRAHIGYCEICWDYGGYLFREGRGGAEACDQAGVIHVTLADPEPLV